MSAVTHRPFRCLLPLAAALLLGACSTVSETGRSQLLFYSDSQMSMMAAKAYAEETGKYKEVVGTPRAQMVQDVGRRIAEASGREYEWEFKLLDAPNVVNAFALPGGKIAVYSGLIEKVAPDPDSLAVIIGHEVAHATSSHGNERMSQNTMAAIGLTAAGVVVANWDKDAQTKAAVMAGLGFATQTGVLLPYSRTHESEADEIGLRFMIRAGFNPHAAPPLWERMAKLSPNRPPALLSTHPDPLQRAKTLQALIPRLMKEEAANRRTKKLDPRRKR